MFNVNTSQDGISEEDRRKTEDIVKRLRESSRKFIRVWDETPAPLWMGVAIDEHNARIATYDYILTVLDLGGSGRTRFNPEYEELPEHYEGVQYIDNCTVDVVLYFVKAYILSGHSVEILVVPESEYVCTDTISAYKIKYKR
jgi:hypothetical protein